MADVLIGGLFRCCVQLAQNTDAPAGGEGHMQCPSCHDWMKWNKDRKAWEWCRDHEGTTCHATE